MPECTTRYTINAQGLTLKNLCVNTCNLYMYNKGVYDIPLNTGSVIVADCFYNDFHLLNVWDSEAVFFVIRHKENLHTT